MTNEQMSIAAHHFIIAAIWADAEENTSPRASNAAKMAALEFVQAFAAAYPELCAAAMAAPGYGAHPDAGTPAAAFGHDLYLTCAGHGVGFADRPELGETGEALAEAIRQAWRRWHVEVYAARGWLHVLADTRKDAPA